MDSPTDQELLAAVEERERRMYDESPAKRQRADEEVEAHMYSSSLVVYFQTDIYMYNIPKCYLQLIICIYSLRLHQKARPVMVAQP